MTLTRGSWPCGLTHGPCSLKMWYAPLCSFSNTKRPGLLPVSNYVGPLLEPDIATCSPAALVCRPLVVHVLFACFSLPSINLLIVNIVLHAAMTDSLLSH